MKTVAIFVLLGASFAFAKDHQVPQSGTILQMDSVNCGTDQKSDRSLAGEIIGTDNTDRKTRTLLCQEYLLQTDRMTYRIRPKDDKHPALLPVGEKAEFHIDKDHLKLRVEGFDDKEREYGVVSVTPRTETRAETHGETQTADNQK
jgi:hypothetical protein